MTEFLASPETVKNCIGWTFSPLLTVGSPCGDLRTTPGNEDFVSRAGSKSQSYTSWDCISRSYVGGVVEVKTQKKRHVHRVKRDVPGDIPTENELEDMTPLERMWYTKGLRVFVRGKGIMSKAQYASYRQIRSTSQTRATPVELASGYKKVVVQPKGGEDLPQAAALTSDPPQKYYYSDIIPVRAIALTSMTSARETEPMPWSPAFQMMAARLNDPASAGPLAPVVKGSNVRDATTWTSLVKSIMIRNTTRYELAAMIRVICMHMSVAQEAYSTDGTPTRFIRKPTHMRFDGMAIYEKPGVSSLKLDIIAMPIDTFVCVANNTHFEVFPRDFSYTMLDVEWIAVPVPTDLIGQTTLIPYIASFLSSELWSGTVNAHYTAGYVEGEDEKIYRHTWLPACNNVHIPGVNRVCLVLIDEVSHKVEPSLTLAIGDFSVRIPIWSGSPNPPDPVDWMPVWQGYWLTRNIDVIRQTTVQAHEIICTRMGVGDACGTALSLAAEMYGQWYQGIAVPYQDGTPNFDYSMPAFGCWTMDGSALDKTKQIKSHKFDLSDEACRAARRRCVAYNFSGVSPYHCCPTGVVRASYTNDTARLRMTWATLKPERCVYGYRAESMTSVFRVAAACGLILTHTDSYAFGASIGMCHWVHMLSCAHSFSTACLLTINDLTPRDWMGIDNRRNNVFRLTIIKGIKAALYSGLLIHRNIEDLFKNIPEWDMDILSDYWGVEPYGSLDWMTFSPVPYHATWQWICKLGMEKAGKSVAPFGSVPFEYDDDKVYSAIELTKDSCEHKSNAVGTIDVYRRYQGILAREPKGGFVPVLHWIDSVHRNSSFMLEGCNIALDPAMYESMTFCANIRTMGLSYQFPTQWYIIRSPYTYGDVQWSGINISPIAWPDPPLLNEIWTTAKNYILKPAASALAGFLTGGPVGAVVGGGTKLLTQAVDDLTASKPKSDQKQEPRPLQEGILIPPKIPAELKSPKTYVLENMKEKEDPQPTFMTGVGEIPLTSLPPVKETPSEASRAMIAKEPIKSLTILDGSPVNE